jgi:dTDP-4-amino-4,6-dideoxygalactose transaminase
MAIRIPYTDHSLIPDELKKGMLIEISRVMRLTDPFEHEQYVAGVEKKLAAYFGTPFAIGVDSGTTAIQLALSALGVGPGDEVLVPTYTYVATALAVTNLGARPVWVDIKESDLTIDPKQLEQRITSRTKAVIPVHIHGFCCDILKIQKICKEYGIALVEDASQAHGALINGKKAGSFGIGCFSLHTSKNLGGIGDAGLVTLNNEAIHQKIKRLLVPDSGTEEALEARRTPCTMDAVQAAIIDKKLSFLNILNKRKCEIASLYDACLAGLNVKKPIRMEGSCPVYRDYPIIVNGRDALQAYLLKKGIETKPGYTPLYLLDTFKKFSRQRNKFPVSESIARRVLCLPSFVGMTDIQIKYIGDPLRDHLKERHGQG